MLGVGSFSYLVYLARKYHRLEYETNIKQMVNFFISLVLLLAFQTINTELALSQIVYTPTLCFFRNHSPKMNVNAQIDFYTNVLGWQSLWLCASFIFFKSDQDILQGISKLDHLLKTSCFQKYKQGSLEANKFSLTTSIAKESLLSNNSTTSSQYVELINKKTDISRQETQKTSINSETRLGENSITSREEYKPSFEDID